MNGLDAQIVIDGIWWVIGGAFTAAALLALVRLVRGPTIVDRMVASDTILTIVICILGADMVRGGHTTTLPLTLTLAMTAFIASVAVARYVSREATPDDEAPVETAAGDGQAVPQERGDA